MLLTCSQLTPPSGRSSRSVTAVQHVSCAIALTTGGGVTSGHDTYYNQLLRPGSAFRLFLVDANYGPCKGQRRQARRTPF